MSLFRISNFVLRISGQSPAIGFVFSNNILKITRIIYHSAPFQLFFAHRVYVLKIQDFEHLILFRISNFVLRVSGQRPVLALFFQISANFTHYFASFCHTFCTIRRVFARFGCGFVLKIQDFELCTLLFDLDPPSSLSFRT